MARTNRAVRRQLTSAPDGPVGRDLRRRGVKVQNRGRILAPVDQGGLRSSIVTDPAGPRVHPLGLVLAIGSPLKYALAVHEGSGSPYAPPSWKSGKQVPARRYLTNALPAAAG